MKELAPVPAHSTQERSSPSLRGAAAAWTAAFGALAIALALSLVYLTHRLHQGTLTVVRHAQSLAISNQIDTRLEAYRRLDRLVSTSDPTFLADRREAIEGDLSTLFADAARLVTGDREREVLERARLELEAAIADHRAAKSEGLPHDETRRRTTEHYDRALAALTELHAIDRAQVESALREAAELDQLANVTGITAAGAIAIGLLGLVLGLRHLVTAPLGALATEIARRGDQRTSIEERGALEVREITRAINQMSAELARERDDRRALVAGVVHDLRSPLSALKMAVAQARSAPVAADRMLGIADRQITVLTRMVGDLLDAASLEAAQLELRREPIDLRTVARSVVDLQRPKTAEHTIDLELSDQPLVVSADALRIEQVIENLVTNAIKYSPGGGRIVVRLERAPGEARITVTDPGIGIPREEIPTLFTPFQRRPAGRAVAAGTGIGLSVVRRIVQAHGGTIEVESEVGVGSTFRVALPAAEAPRTATPPSVGVGDDS